MMWLLTKYCITAGMVVLISEIAKRSDRVGGLVAALPLVTILSLIWLQIESQSQEKIANHAWYTFWYVIPTLPMFLLFPYLLPRLGFWFSLLASCVFTAILFAVFALLLKRFGVVLW
jgi:Na+(H+)/acetate symporter ActP